MTAMNNDLLPCPFCGAKARMLGGPEAQETYSVWCESEGRRHHVCGTMDADETAAIWNTRAIPAAQVAVKPLEWDRDWQTSFTMRSMKKVDDGCEVHFIDYVSGKGLYKIRISTVAKPGYIRVTYDGSEFPSLEAAKAAAQADYEARIRSALTVTPAQDVAGLVEARRKHIELVGNYRTKRDEVNKLRDAGDWSQNIDAEFQAMEAGRRDFFEAAQTFADAALARMKEAEE